MKVFHYIDQLQFSIVRLTALFLSASLRLYGGMCYCYSTDVLLNVHSSNGISLGGLDHDVLHSGYLASGFEPSSCYYVDFWIYTFGKEIHHPPSDGLNSTSSVLLDGCFCHLITQEDWNAIKKLKKYLLATIVEGDQKAPFLIATALRCRGRAHLFSLDCSSLPLIRTLYCWVLSKEVSSIIFKVFGMTWSGILLGWVFANGHTKTLKMVLDISLLNTQQYKVRIKGKVEQSGERSSTLPYTSVL